MRIGRFVLAAALGVTSVGAFAQMDYKDPYKAEQNGKPMPPPAALDALLGLYEFQLMSAAQAMPADRYSFAPSAGDFAAASPEKFTGVRTFAQQLTHLIGANYFFYSSLTPGPMPPEAKASQDLKSKDEIVAALKKSFAYAHAQVATITPANAFLGIKGVDGMHTPVTVATFGVAHGYDHYGQIVEYMRMNGILPEGSK